MVQRITAVHFSLDRRKGQVSVDLGLLPCFPARAAHATMVAWNNPVPGSVPVLDWLCRARKVAMLHRRVGDSPGWEGVTAHMMGMRCCWKTRGVRHSLMPNSPLACEHARSSRILQQYRMTLQILPRVLLLGLLLVLVAACGGDALDQCDETVSGLEAQNRELQGTLVSSQADGQELQAALAESQDENQVLQDALALSQDENQELQDDLARTQDENQQLQDTLASSQDENQRLQDTLADAQAESERLREELDQAAPDPDLSSVRERLWLLFHDRSQAVWACDDTASQVVPVEVMPSASPAEMVQKLNDRFQELNPECESPGLALEVLDGDTAVVSLARASVVTEQMGSTGAQCYLAGVTFSLTSFEAIDHVRFEFKEGSHGAPGRYDRTDFVYFLPLERDQL